MQKTRNLKLLQETLRYGFKKTSLLEESLRHSSYVNEQPAETLRDNERMEFLGDAFLSLAVGHLLMHHYPRMREGELSRIRANLVNETMLAEIARDLDLGPHLLLGKGEALSKGHEKNSLLANVMEAVIAAIYIDGGFEAAFGFVEYHFKALIKSAPSLGLGHDFKSRLQEEVQSSMQELPQYRVVRESGPDHDKTFHVSMTAGPIETQGKGKSKKTAEQEAARAGLELFASQEE